MQDKDQQGGNGRTQGDNRAAHNNRLHTRTIMD